MPLTLQNIVCQNVGCVVLYFWYTTEMFLEGLCHFTFFKKNFWRTQVFFVRPLIPLFSEPGWIPRLRASSPAHNAFLRFTSGAALADLLTTSMVNNSKNVPFFSFLLQFYCGTYWKICPLLLLFHSQTLKRDPVYLFERIKSCDQEVQPSPFMRWLSSLVCVRTFEVFVFNTNQAFLTFLYNIDIEGFWKVSAKNKLAPTGNWTHKPTITGLEF